MRLLVCGGCGFIGSNFIRLFLDSDPDGQIVNYDALTYAADPHGLDAYQDDARYTFVRGDIADKESLESVLEAHAVDAIINFAAETHVDRSIHGDATLFVRSNTVGVQVLLDLVRHHRISRFLHVSTDEVFGDLPLDSGTPFTEASPFKPNSPYSAAKAGGDLLCRAAWQTHRVPVLISNCSNNYGPYQFPEKLIPSFILRLMEGETLPLYGDGRYVRDWIHVSDHARALLFLLKNGAPGEMYLIGSDNERSNLDVALMLADLFGVGKDVFRFVEDRKGHDRRYAINASKIRSLGWSPLYPAERFAEGLKETVDWYKAHMEWVTERRARKAEWDEQSIRV